MERPVMGAPFARSARASRRGQDRRRSKAVTTSVKFRGDPKRLQTAFARRTYLCPSECVPWRRQSWSENGNDGLAHDLARFVAFSGHHNDVPRLHHSDRRADRFGAIADLAGARRAGQDLGADGGRILRPRIIVRDDGDVGARGRDRSHDGALAAVAIATAAEYADELAGHERAHAVEGRFKRFGLVGVVDNGERAVPLADDFEAAFDAGETLRARE